MILCGLQDSEITHVSDTIDLDSMDVEESYTGPRMDGESMVMCFVYIASTFVWLCVVYQV